MDSNKDEAERCIKIALNAIGNNQPDKARKFLEKAQRLFPTDKAKSKSNKLLFATLSNVEGQSWQTEQANANIAVINRYRP